MARVLQLLALMLAFVVSGAPAWAGELLEDDCAEECADESGCPDEGCADCSVVCSACPRTHVVVPPVASVQPVVIVDVAWLAPEAVARMPVGPPPRGVFHPPRARG